MDVDGATQWLEMGWVLTVERNRKLSLSLHKGQIQLSAWIGLFLQHKKRLRFFCVPLCAAELHLSRSVPRHLCGWDRAAGWGAIPYPGRMGYRAVMPHRACFGDCAASGHRPRTFLPVSSTCKAWNWDPLWLCLLSSVRATYGCSSILSFILECGAINITSRGFGCYGCRHVQSASFALTANEQRKE